MKFISLVAVFALLNQDASATRLTVGKCSPSDKYCDTNEYDS